MHVYPRAQMRALAPRPVASRFCRITCCSRSSSRSRLASHTLLAPCTDVVMYLRKAASGPNGLPKTDFRSFAFDPPFSLGFHRRRGPHLVTYMHEQNVTTHGFNFFFFLFFPFGAFIPSRYVYRLASITGPPRASSIVGEDRSSGRANMGLR